MILASLRDALRTWRGAADPQPHEAGFVADANRAALEQEPLRARLLLRVFGITVLLALVWLGEHLALPQWIGAGLLILSLFLVGFDKITPQKRNTTGWMAWLNPPKIAPGDVPWQSQP